MNTTRTREMLASGRVRLRGLRSPCMQINGSLLSDRSKPSAPRETPSLQTIPQLTNKTMSYYWCYRLKTWSSWVRTSTRCCIDAVKPKRMSRSISANFLPSQMMVVFTSSLHYAELLCHFGLGILVWHLVPIIIIQLSFPPASSLCFRMAMIAI